MGKDKKAKQKKKAQKTIKHRAKKVEHKKQIVASGGGAPVSMRAAFTAPIYECWEPVQLFAPDRGMGSAVITRKASGHHILMGVFLLDVFCLGVKDAFVKLLSESEYRNYLGELKKREGLRSISPACARKLIEDTEAYALDLGFKAHRDYQKAKKIFGDIDTAECTRTFEFGRDGKPLYIAGPYDSQTFQARVMKTLSEKVGPDGFHFIAPMGLPPDEFFE